MAEEVDMGKDRCSDTESGPSTVDDVAIRAAFTPGPWIAEKANDTDETWAVKRETMQALFVAKVFNAGAGSIEATARLIAAAPDMYAALYYVETVMMIVLPRSHMREYMACLAQVRAALAKAVPGTDARTSGTAGDDR